MTSNLNSLVLDSLLSLIYMYQVEESPMTTGTNPARETEKKEKADQKASAQRLSDYK